MKPVFHTLAITAAALLPLVFCFIAVGVLVGFFGGFISIRKYLKKEGNEIIGW